MPDRSLYFMKLHTPKTPYRVRLYVKHRDGFDVSSPLYVQAFGPYWLLDFSGTLVAMKPGVDCFIIK